MVEETTLLLSSINGLMSGLINSPVVKMIPHLDQLMGDAPDTVMSPTPELALPTAVSSSVIPLDAAALYFPAFSHGQFYVAVS